MALIPDGVKGLSLLINGLEGLVVSVDNHIGPLLVVYFLFEGVKVGTHLIFIVRHNS